ncbi:DUF4124 domain-containing protein [Nitrosomonas sp. wSCUT-2]
MFFIVLISLSFPLSAGIYKHVDEKGNVTYSNIPSNNAKQLNLPPIVVVPPVDSGDVEERIARRRESMKLEEQKEKLQSKISEEEKRLSEVKNEYKDGNPDRLGSERNYQRYLDRVERLRSEIDNRENNLKVLKKELNELSEKKNTP